MNKKLILGLTIGLFSSQTFAVSFGSFDPRSLAMGGVGVASGDASNASYYNPALLALTNEDDDFSLVIPTINIGISDPDNLTDELDAYGNGNYESALDTEIVNFNNAGVGNNILGYISAAGSVATASQNLLTAVQKLSNKSIIMNSGAGVLLAVPSPSFAVAVSYSGRLVGGGNLDISAADLSLINSYVSVLACIGNIDTTLGAAALAAAYTACDTDNLINDADGSFNNTNTTTTLTSRIKARGATITETSVSFARLFPVLGGVSVGVTPKSVEVNTFDYAIGLDNADISTDTGQLKHNDTNIDLGAAMNLTKSIKVGLVAKNLVGKSYRTALNNTVNVETQYRAGIAYQNDWVLAAFDLDLTKNKGLGFEPDTQFASLGFEFDAYDILKLRAGYKQNLEAISGREASITSFGIGFNIVAVHFDLGITQNDDELSGAFQLGIQF